jgi:hypothetical protein
VPECDRKPRKLGGLRTLGAVAVWTESEHNNLTLSNPNFLPPAYSPALIYFGRETSWWISCNYPTVLKQKNKEYNLRYLLAKFRTT